MEELKTKTATVKWTQVGPIADFPLNSGSCVKIGNEQIAVYRFERMNRWYATQNLCPHRQEMVLSRGLLGASGEAPFVACPLHKKRFALENGSCLDAEELSLRTYPIKIDGGFVFVGISE